MNRRSVIAAVLCLLALVQPCHRAHAMAGNTDESFPTQHVGQPCNLVGMTTLSYFTKQGVIQCIPDGYGRLFWQPMGAGGILYDNSIICSTAGTLRWNGKNIQFCDGAQWLDLNGTQNSGPGG